MGLFIGIGIRVGDTGGVSGGGGILNLTTEDSVDLTTEDPLVLTTEV